MISRALKMSLMCSACSLPVVAAAHGADLVLYTPQPMAEVDAGLTLPAVSGINGKWELSGGYISPTGGALRAGGSLSIPIGDRFGFQGDTAWVWTPTGLTVSAAAHAFTRDPSRYLAGITAGVVVAPGATLGAIGAEGGLYLGDISLEGWAGVASINYIDPALADQTGLFGIADVAYYAADDFRVALGGSYILGDLSLKASTEYLFRDFGTPLSLTADARLHNSGAYSIMVGLKGYIGGDNDTSLKDRHRQDDPPNPCVGFVHRWC